MRRIVALLGDPLSKIWLNFSTRSETRLGSKSLMGIRSGGTGRSMQLFGTLPATGVRRHGVAIRFQLFGQKVGIELVEQ
jgi:hypothetical protein